MSEIVLKVQGQSFSGWTSIRINKSILNMAGSFGFATTFAPTDKFLSDPRKINIAMGDACTVEIDDQVVITGYVEDIPLSYDNTNHNIQIAGRDKTADLIDCSYIGTKNEWKSPSTITSIITALCEPFGVSVVVDDTVTAEAATKIETFKANEGDTVFDLILKLCKYKAILPMSYGDGSLTLTQARTLHTHDDLELGVNILSGSLDQSNKDRFQTYIVKGQGSGDDSKSSLPMFTSPTSSASITDDVVLRHRPMVIFAEGQIDEGKCIERAKWERNIRAGQSRSLTYTVQGWTQSNGVVWPLNTLVRIKDEFLNPPSPMLIIDIRYGITNDEGETTKLTLMHPDAFSILEEPIDIATGWDWQR